MRDHSAQRGGSRCACSGGSPGSSSCTSWKMCGFKRKSGTKSAAFLHEVLGAESVRIKERRKACDYRHFTSGPVQPPEGNNDIVNEQRESTKPFSRTDKPPIVASSSVSAELQPCSKVLMPHSPLLIENIERHCPSSNFNLKDKASFLNLLRKQLRC